MQPSWSVGDSSAGHVESLCSPELHFPHFATDDDDLQLSPPFCRHRGRPSASDVTSGERTGTDVTEPAGSSSRCRRSGCQAAGTRGARSAVVRAVAERLRTVWPTEEDRGANSSAASGGGVVTQRRRRPPLLVDCHPLRRVVTSGNGQVVEAAATGRNQSRRWFLSESRRRVVVTAEIQLLGRRRRWHASHQWQLCWLTSTTEQA